MEGQSGDVLSIQDVYDSFAFLVSLVMLPTWDTSFQDSCRRGKMSSGMTHTIKIVLLGIGHAVSRAACSTVSHSIKVVIKH